MSVRAKATPFSVGWNWIDATKPPPPPVWTFFQSQAALTDAAAARMSPAPLILRFLVVWSGHSSL